MATIREIAEYAKVSVGTVSFVLNGKGEEMRITSATQQRVLEAAKALGYSPSLSARRLRSKYEEIPVIAILWTLDTRTSLVSRFLQGIQKKSLYKDGLFELVIQPYENDKLSEEHNLQSGMRYNGAIVANASNKDLRFLEKGNFNVPIVVYQRKSSKFNTVYVDSKKTGEMVAEKFLLNNHKKIGMVIPNISSQAVEQRALGFKGKLNKHKLMENSKFEYYGEFSEEGGFKVAKQFLQENKDRFPTALFFLSDHMAIGALKAFQQAGVKIPEDLEIIGHDNESFTQFTTPSLTTVHLPVEEMVDACVRLLLDLVKRETDLTHSLEFESHIVDRDSSLTSFFNKNRRVR